MCTINGMTFRAPPCILLLIKTTIYTCPSLMKRVFSRQIFEKSSNIKFHEDPSGGSPFPWGRTDGKTNRRIDMAKLIVAFRNFANATKTTNLNK